MCAYVYISMCMRERGRCEREREKERTKAGERVREGRTSLKDNVQCSLKIIKSNSS